jgi:hypothetical protein
MINVYLNNLVVLGTSLVSVLKLDIDVNAERTIVYDGDTFDLIVTKNCNDEKVFNLFFDEKYSTGATLNVMIIDTDLNFNGAVATGVVCQLVDANILL